MYTVFRTGKKVVDSYLYKLLKTEMYRQVFEIWTNASVNRRGSLRWKDFSKIEVPLPSPSEQQEIADILDTAKAEIDLLRRERDALAEQKKGLMQLLLTGEVRVMPDPEDYEHPNS